MFTDKATSFKQSLRISGLLLCLLPSACSTSFTYNQLDWLIPWYMDSYVDLNGEQKELLKTRLDPLLNWHRREELASYISLLDKIESDLEQVVEVETVRNWLSEVRQALDRIEYRLLQLFLEMGESMNDEQIADFIISLMEKQQEYRDEYSTRSDAEYAKENYKRLAKNLRRFSGKLDSEQKKKLRSAAESMQRFDLPWLQDRELWLAKITKTLEREPAWQMTILKAYEERDESRSEDYRRTLNHNTTLLAETLTSILNGLGSSQKIRIKSEIAKLRKKINKLRNRK